jgi:hypothetical protein
MSKKATTPRPLRIARTVYPDNPAPSFEAWIRWIRTGQDWTEDPDQDQEARMAAVLDRFKASLLPQRPAR